MSNLPFLENRNIFIRGRNILFSFSSGAYAPYATRLKLFEITILSSLLPFNLYNQFFLFIFSLFIESKERKNKKKGKGKVRFR